MTLTHLRGARHARRPSDRLRHLRDALVNAQAERSLVREAAASLVAGPSDAAVLRRLAGRASVHVIPNGVSLPPPVAQGHRSSEPSVIFTGVLSFPPNVDAAIWFAREVLPLVRRVHPSARFVAAGRRPAPEVVALGALPGVSIEADVADMTACLRRAWVAVAPMRRGAGVKNKVLEAWAAGLPVVMTPIATNGLSLDAEARPGLGATPKSSPAAWYSSSRSRTSSIGAGARRATSPSDSMPGRASATAAQVLDAVRVSRRRRR